MVEAIPPSHPAAETAAPQVAWNGPFVGNASRVPGGRVARDQEKWNGGNVGFRYAVAMSDHEKLEKRGLVLSIIGALFMAALGFGFAVLTSSDAVLLDGFFSLIGFAIGLVSLRVASLVRRPDDEFYHFGYAAYEPMLNLTKGLLMAFVTLFALVSAILVVIEGGREIEAGWASVYAWVAAAGCFAIAVSQRALAKKTSSPLLVVDSKNWLIDGLMSVAVGIAFLVAVFLADTPYDHLLPYADPAVVIILVILSLPIPFKIIRENWKQMLGRAPDETVQEKARAAVEKVLDTSEEYETKIRMDQLGRLTYLQLYVVIKGSIDPDVSRLDACRKAVHDALKNDFDKLAIDVIFTRDPRWIGVSVGASVVSSEHPPQGGSKR
jgi:cation diffusion facilitator family transporter